MSIIFLNRTARAYGSPAKKILRKILHSYYKRKTPEYISMIAKKISKVSKGTSVFSAKYLANMSYKRCIYPVDLFMNRKRHSFEDYKFYSFQNPDTYLTIMYGDYMVLPPVSERETHNMKVYYGQA